MFACSGFPAPSNDGLFPFFRFAYKVNWLSYQLAKRLVKLPYITIANLVTGKGVYEELLQYDAVPEKLAPALERILPNGNRREEVLAGVAECVSLLGGESPVSRKVSEKVLEIAERER